VPWSDWCVISEATLEEDDEDDEQAYQEVAVDSASSSDQDEDWEAIVKRVKNKKSRSIVCGCYMKMQYGLTMYVCVESNNRTNCCFHLNYWTHFDSSEEANILVLVKCTDKLAFWGGWWFREKLLIAYGDVTYLKLLPDWMVWDGSNWKTEKVCRQSISSWCLFTVSVCVHICAHMSIQSLDLEIVS